MTDTRDRHDRQPEQVSHVVLRFAGDSGDGMQLTGTQFTETTAIAGNDLATFPHFPHLISTESSTEQLGRLPLNGLDP